MGHKSVKILKLVTAGLFLVAMVVLCHEIIVESVTNQTAKHEYAEANHIKYGLFSVNTWKEKLQVIVTDEINEFNFSKANQKQVKEHIQVQLSGLIDKVYERIRESNKASFKGKLKQAFINAFVDINEIKKGIPDYTDSIMKELSKAQTERKIKKMLKRSVSQYFEKTFDEQDLSKVDEIVQETGAKDLQEARAKLQEEIRDREQRIYLQTAMMIGLAMVLFVLMRFGPPKMQGYQFGLLVFALLALLSAGVATPMIDMEAKISELKFVLMDHEVRFTDQILYFQSKSIMDVFAIMIAHKDWQMKAVGILMVTFSIIFPILKLISSIIYFNDYRNLRNHKIIQFFVLKSGKWSMADVLVVAIFMAYIGFNGIITSQLGKLSQQSEDVMVLATNGTTLQPGFFIFLTYAALALFLPGFLQRNEKA
jgi:hypothetical protein